LDRLSELCEVSPSAQAVDCHEKVIGENRHLPRNGFGLANTFFGTSGHYRTYRVWPGSEQI
jgi:hypothetical protein